jgi:hypothetical protein
MAGSVAELRWKKVAKPGLGAIADLPKSVRGEDPVVHGGRLWLVGAELQTWVREKKGWRDLGPAGPRLWSETEVTGAEGAYGLFTNADRLTVATSSGRVFELVDDTWILVHRPDKEVPLWSSEMAYDPLGKRIVSWLGGKIGSSTGTRYGKGRTWIYERGAWRLASEERLSHASAKIRVFFDPGLKRVVRAWAKDVGVLGEDGWDVFHPEQYEADWQAVYADPRTGEVVTTHLFPDSTEVARLELARCVTAGQLPPIDDPPGDVARWFDAEARTLFCEDRRDPRRAWAVDLGPAFDAAKKRGPRTQPEAAAKSGKKKPA